MIDNWNDLGEVLSELENRLGLLEGLHTPSNSHLLNSENNDILKMYQEGTQEDVKFLESYLKFQTSVLNDIVMLKKTQKSTSETIQQLRDEMHGLSGYVKTLSQIKTSKSDPF